MKIKKVMEGPRDGEIRCQACFTRFRPKLGTGRAKCPHCGIEWLNGLQRHSEKRCNQAREHWAEKPRQWEVQKNEGRDAQKGNRVRAKCCKLHARNPFSR